ncbi:MAG: hypothetical protein NTU61_00555 [Candidatus Altiarchaeota archaeon]|nr:hypothetical protein [Candidatus Altiarchaeota archaeon]
MEMLEKLREAKLVFVGLRAYKLALDFIIGFLIAAVLLVLLGVNLAFWIIPASIYFLAQIFMEARRVNIIRHLESKYGNLRERLSTAYDNRGRRNLIVDDLMADVSGRLDDVSASSFVESKALTSKTVTTVFLTFLLLTATLLNIRGFMLDLLKENPELAKTLDDTKEKYTSQLEAMMGDRWEGSNWSAQDDEKLGAESGGERPGFGQGPVPGRGFGVGSETSSDIYGKASSATLDGKDIDFRLHPEYGGNIEIQESQGKVKPEEFKLTSVESADTCDDCAVGPEHEEIVRRYFEKILEGS